MNNLATSEQEIMAMASGLAGVGRQVGMSEGDIVGMAGSLSSLGIGAEKGGSSMSKFLINMQLATEQGGESLEQFASVAGMSSDEFATAFGDNASGAFNSFIGGLAKIEAEGGSVIGTLDDMGISEIRLRDTILKAAGGHEIFTESMQRGNRAFSENTALMDESNLRYETAESKLAMMKNRITDVGIELGGALAPSVIDIADKIATVVEKFGSLDMGMQTSIVKMGAFGLVAGTSLNVLGKGMRGLDSTMNVVSKLSGGFTVAGESVSAFTKLGSLMSNPYVLGATAIVGAVALIGKAWSNHNKEIEAEQQAEKDRLDGIYENYNEKQINNTEAIDFLKKNGDEYDRLNAKLGENRDLTNLTTQEQQKYHDLVGQMMDSGAIVGYYDDMGNAMSDSTEKANTLTEALERQMDVNTAEMIRSKSDQMDNIQEEKKAIEGRNEQEQKSLEMMKERLEAGTKLETKQGVHGSKQIEVEMSPKEMDELAQQIQELEIIIQADGDFEEVLAKAKQVAEVMEGEIFKDLDFAESLSGSMDGLRDEIFANSDDWGEAEKQATSLAIKAKEVAQALGEDFNTDTLKDYSTYLRDIGIGYEETIQSTSEMALITKGQEEGMNAVSDAVSQFTNDGIINAETVQKLSELYGDLGIKADMSGGQILGLLANHDQFLAGLIVTEDVFNSLEQAQASLGDSFRDNAFELNMDNLNEHTEKIRTTKEESINEAVQLKDGMLSALEGLEEVLPPDIYAEAKQSIIDDFTEVEERINGLEIQNINDLLQASLDGGKSTDVTKALLEQFGEIDGYTFDEKNVKFVAESKGVDKVIKDVENLEGIWGKTTEEREFHATSIGLDEVAFESQELQDTWNGLSVEEKIFLAEAHGIEEVKNADMETMNQWLANMPGMKEYLMSENGSESVIGGAGRARDAWNSLTTEQKEFLMNEIGSGKVVSGANAAAGAWGRLKGGTKEFITKYTTIGSPPSGPGPRREVKYDPMNLFKYTGDNSFEPNAYATGTTGGMGLAYVSEMGQELLRYPNGQLELTGHTGAELRALPKGTQVFNHMDTRGILDGSLEAPIDNPIVSNTGGFVKQTKDKKKAFSPPAFAKGNTKADKKDAKKKPTKAKKSDTTAKYNDHRYLKWESEIERLSGKLDVLKGKEDTLFNDKDIIRSQEWQLTFYKRKQQLVHETAQEMRKERGELRSQLNKAGFRFKGSGDEMLITNLNTIQGKSKETEEALKRFYELQDKEIPSQQKLYYDFAKSIKDVTAEVNKFFAIDTDREYLDQDLALLKVRGELAKSNQELILLKNEELQINKLIQANLHQQAQETRSQRDAIEELLKAEGIRFTGQGDNKRISNLNAIEGKTQKVLDLTEEYIQLTQDQKGFSTNWLEKQLDIQASEVEKLNLQFELADTTVNNLKESMSDLEYSFQMLDDDNFEDQIKNTTKSLANMEWQILETFREFNELGENGFVKGSMQAKAFSERQAELKERLKESTLEAKKFKEVLESLKDSVRLEFISKENKLYEEQQDRLQSLESIQESIVQIIRKRGEEEKKQLDEAHKDEMKSLEDRHKSRKDKYKEDLDLFKKTIQDKIDALDDQYAEEDYADELSKEQEKANQIQAEIDKLSMDDSIEARTKTIELRKDLADQNETIVKKQQRRERDLLKKSLQDKLKDEEKSVKDIEEIADKSYNEEKKRLEEDHKINKEFLDKKYSDEKVYAEAKESIIRGTVEVSEGAFVDIYDAYTDFEDKFGKGMGIMGDIIKSEFLDKLGQAQQAIKDLEYEMDNVITKLPEDYELQDGDKGKDIIDKIEQEIEDSRDEVEEDIKVDKFDQHTEDFNTAHSRDDWRGMIRANENANEARGDGRKITATAPILTTLSKAFRTASDRGDWEEMIATNKKANEIRTGKAEITASDAIATAIGQAYVKASDRLDWKEMERLNRQANIVRGQGNVVTAQNHIESVKKKANARGYSQGGKDDQGGMAMLHGSKSAPEYIFNYPQFQDLAKMIAQHELTMPNVSQVDLGIDFSKLAKMTTSRSSDVSNSPIEIKMDNLINVEGNANAETVKSLQSEGDNMVNKLKNTLSKIGVTRGVRR